MPQKLSQPRHHVTKHEEAWGGMHDDDSRSPSVAHHVVCVRSRITDKQADFGGKKYRNAYALMLIKGPWTLLLC